MSLLYNWILNYSYYFIHWSRGHYYYYNIILQNYLLLSADSFAILYIHILTWRRLLHLCTVYIISWVVEYLHDMIHTMNWGLQANPPPPWFIMPEITSMGTGNTMVLLFSADILFRVCRYRSWNIHLSIGSYDYDKYTIRSIVCEASFRHSVTWSLSLLVTPSLGHLVIWSLDYFVNTGCSQMGGMKKSL